MEAQSLAFFNYNKWFVTNVTVSVMMQLYFCPKIKILKMNLEKFLKDNVSIVDVRTREEFNGGHVSGSINIPLQEIQERVDEFRKMNGPVVLCCASGNRSGMAAGYLKHQGIDCVNGGSWLDVNYYQSLNV